MKIRPIDQLVPVGENGRRERKQILWGLGLSAAWSMFAFSINYLPPLMRILRRPEERIAGISLFHTLCKYTPWGFEIVGAAMILLALSHYLCHYREGRSIYLMRRLPDKWDLWRRCLALPLMGVAGCIVLNWALWTVYFLIYQFCTPPDYIGNLMEQTWLYRLFYRIFL